MSYLVKGMESEQVGIICYENKNYNSCVNRYYYSFYQKLLHKLKSKEIELDEEMSGGSHERAFNTFIDEVLRPIKRPKPTEIRNMRSLYGNFKNLRKVADYKEEQLSKEEVDDAIKYYNQLNEKINII